MNGIPLKWSVEHRPQECLERMTEVISLTKSAQGSFTLIWVFSPPRPVLAVFDDLWSSSMNDLEIKNRLTFKRLLGQERQCICCHTLQEQFINEIFVFRIPARRFGLLRCSLVFFGGGHGVQKVDPKWHLTTLITVVISGKRKTYLQEIHRVLCVACLNPKANRDKRNKLPSYCCQNTFLSQFLWWTTVLFIKALPFL